MAAASWRRNRRARPWYARHHAGRSWLELRLDHGESRRDCPDHVGDPRDPPSAMTPVEPREPLGADVTGPVGLFLAEPMAPASAGTWLGHRARNAARRTALLGVAGGLVFVAMLVTLIVIPHRARRAAAAIMPRPTERPDTVRLMAADAIAADQLARAEAALARARARAARRALPLPPDTLPTEARLRRDSLQASIARL